MKPVRIAVDGLHVRCLVGTLDPERCSPQLLRVCLWLDLDASAAAAADELRLTRDYSALAREVSFLLEEGRFHLIETAGRVLLRQLLLPPPPGFQRPAPIAAGVRIEKSGALPGRAVASVSLEGLACDEEYRAEQQPWGTVRVVAESHGTGIYRLELDPGAVIPTHHHRRMREAELVLDRGLEGWGDDEVAAPLAPGARQSWRLGQRHGYHNRRRRVASLLCVDSPPFSPEDEVPG